MLRDIKSNTWFEKGIYRANTNQKQIDKADFKTKIIIRDKERHYLMIKGSVFQEDLMILNM